MRYVLIMKYGKVMVFNVKQCAVLYQQINGGTLVATFPTEANVERLSETYTQA
jgi:hypothetical protein